MEYRQLGSTGIRVSELCLGTMTFGNEADESTSRKLVDRFVDAGGNFVDTADVYAEGASEEITGRALHGRRDDLCWRRRCASPYRPRRQRLGRHVVTSAWDRCQRCAASGRTGSTCTRSTAGTRLRRSRRPCRRSTTSCTRARSAAPAASNYTAWQLAKASGTRAGTAGTGSSRSSPVLADHPRHRARAAAAVPRRGAGRAPVEPARRWRAHREVPRGRGLPEGIARRHRGADHVTYRLPRTGVGHAVEAVYKVAAELGRRPRRWR